MLIRQKGAAPLYSQIEAIIKEQIERGDYVKGDIYPSEKILQETYSVSRITIRQAMNELVNAGYLKCSRGIGTIVVFEKIDETLKHVISFTDEMKQHGITMNTSYCNIKSEKADKTIASKLKIKNGEECYKLTRVRCAKGFPIVYSITYLRKIHELPMEPEYYTESLYQFLREKYDIKIVKGKDTLEAIVADEDIAKHLEISINSPVFKGKNPQKFAG